MADWWKLISRPLPGMEEISDEVTDPAVQGGRLGLARDDDAGHGIEPALGVPGGEGRRVDGQASGPVLR